MNTGAVLRTQEGRVAFLTLKRPAKHNSVTDAMWVQLAEHMSSLSDAPDVDMVVIAGEGSVFSSGADLSDLVEASGHLETAMPFCSRIAEALHAVATSSKFTVAALKHHVRGGGAEIALSCDIRLAEPNVRFQIPVARLGVVPDRITLRRLMALAGPSVARRVLLLTEELDAQSCLQVGLVDQLVAPGGLDHGVERLARTLARNAGMSIQVTKRMLLEEEELLDEPGNMIQEFVGSVRSEAVTMRARDVLNRTR